MLENDSNRSALILGALLHDIGKFVQRAKDNPDRPGKRHTVWGDEWFEEYLSEKLTAIFSEKEKQLIRTAISNHHNSERYISLADSISAGMDRIDIDKNEERGDPFNDRLVSIFSKLSISEKPKKEMYYRMLPLSRQIGFSEIFPLDNKKCEKGEYAGLLASFNKDIKMLNLNGLSPAQAIEKIYFLLWKYTWCVPSAVYLDEPDVSLFDHLKTTAAISSCLYDFDKEYSKIPDIEASAFQLIAGDVSGIQNYIYDVLNQQGKVAKRLRARSFFVQMLSEIASHRILHAFNLPLCNITSSAGGNFYILAPNLKDSEEKIAVLEEVFNEWAYERFQAQLYISLGRVKTNGRELAQFNLLVEDRLKPNTRLKKYKPCFSVMTENNKWKIDKFVQAEIARGDEGICSGCHKHPTIDEEEKLCEGCLIDVKIGSLLPKAKYITFFKDNKHGFPALGYSFEIWQDIEADSSAYLLSAVNNTSNIEAGFKFLANYVPAGENGSLSFEDIAGLSKGDNLLGYLKIDIDNMGRILREGFKKPSISRFSSISWMTELFFSGYIEARMKSDFKDAIYTVFSGGDDLFVLGQWNRIIDFAKEIRDRFREYTARNPDITFSAGIILAKDYEPISFCAEYVNSELKKSKSFDNEDKDRITLFNQTIKWHELDKVINESERIIKWLKEEPPKVSRGFIHNLRKYGEMHQQYKKTKETRYLKFVPLLTDDINRNCQDEVKRWAENLSPMIDKKIEDDNLPYLRAIMEYVLTYTRGG